MSTSTIGTIFPSVPGSALVKVGIPQAGGFTMEDGLVPVESLIPTSGTWIPEVSNVAGTATINVADNAYYTKVGNIVTQTVVLNIQMDVLQTEEQFSLSTAILRATDFPNSKSLRGTWSLVDSDTALVSHISILSSGGSKLIDISIASTEGAGFSLSLHHQYTLA
jgi:hypothetical protein